MSITERPRVRAVGLTKSAKVDVEVELSIVQEIVQDRDRKHLRDIALDQRARRALAEINATAWRESSMRKQVCY